MHPTESRNIARRISYLVSRIHLWRAQLRKVAFACGDNPPKIHGALYRRKKYTHMHSLITCEIVSRWSRATTVAPSSIIAWGNYELGMRVSAGDGFALCATFFFNLDRWSESPGPATDIGRDAFPFEMIGIILIVAIVRLGNISPKWHSLFIMHYQLFLHWHWDWRPVKEKWIEADVSARWYFRFLFKFQANISHSRSDLWTWQTIFLALSWHGLKYLLVAVRLEKLCMISRKHCVLAMTSYLPQQFQISECGSNCNHLRMYEVPGRFNTLSIWFKLLPSWYYLLIATNVPCQPTIRDRNPSKNFFGPSLGS